MLRSYERANHHLSKTCKRVAKQLAKDNCQAYELDLTVTRSKRYGNLFLDTFAFNRKTRETGWNFKALVVLNCGKAVYRLWSGEPNLERYETMKKPLGPLQELDGTIHVPSPY